MRFARAPEWTVRHDTSAILIRRVAPCLRAVESCVILYCRRGLAMCLFVKLVGWLRLSALRIRFGSDKQDQPFAPAVLNCNLGHHPLPPSFFPSISLRARCTLARIGSSQPTRSFLMEAFYGASYNALRRRRGALARPLFNCN